MYTMYILHTHIHLLPTSEEFNLKLDHEDIVSTHMGSEDSNVIPHKEADNGDSNICVDVQHPDVTTSLTTRSGRVSRKPERFGIDI